VSSAEIHVCVCIHVVHSVFKIKISGLRPEQWRELRSTGYGNSPMVGLRPSAIRCIPPQIFKVGIKKTAASTKSLLYVSVTNFNY
jgi:hypothetical protein